MMVVKRIFFHLQYLLNDPPWDTGVTPPEVYRFLERTPPGKALDLGCGTGTNAITLAEHGWQVVGIDFVPRAIRKARRKARRAGVEDRVEFRVGNVLELDEVEGPFDLILDIGCFHGFSNGEVRRYAKNVQDLAAFKGTLLLYTHLKTDPDDDTGACEEDLALLEEKLKLVNRENGWEGESRPSAWMEYEKGAAQV
jgi:cyclopropane fatty-acyl-phospholipid synthase-like methyltransferase